MNNKCKKLATIASFAFFPSRCCACGHVIYPRKEICTFCMEKILRVPDGKFCKGCGQSLKKCLCQPEPFLTSVCAPFFYEGEVRQQLQRFKFSDRPHMAKSYAKIAAKYITDCGCADGAELITFIPMTPTAIKNRGYNQAEVFASALGEILHIPCEPLLVKTADTPPQHDLSGLLRRGNLTGIYEVPPEKEAAIKDKVILLADDITTTGSTLHEAAKTLLIFGAKDVRGVCIARAPAHKQMMI